jgi:hypothetical protein
MVTLGAVGVYVPAAATARPAVDENRTAAQTPTDPAPAETDPLQDPAVQREIARLASRDREVRAHEQAHVAAGGSVITSGPSYTYQTGPDRRRYAVGGEVGIDSSAVSGDPQATIAKARQIRAAALAPAQPSAQDLRVAAKAAQMEQSARQELAQAQRDGAYRAAGPETNRPPGSLVAAVA